MNQTTSILAINVAKHCANRNSNSSRMSPAFIEPLGVGSVVGACSHLTAAALQVCAERVRHSHLLWSTAMRFKYLRVRNENAQAAQLQPVERRLAGHRRAILAARTELAREHRQYRIMAQLVVVVEIAATTARPSTGSNPKKSGLHSVSIGALRESTMNCCGTTVFVDSQPRSTQ
jgi:hypothetical protein